MLETVRTPKRIIVSKLANELILRDFIILGYYN